MHEYCNERKPSHHIPPLNYKISAIFVYSFLNMFAPFINLGPLILCADNAVSALPCDTCTVLGITPYKPLEYLSMY